jgi:hypothetical protein
MNKRDKQQLEIWHNIYQFMSASFQIQDDALQIDKDREAYHNEQHNREKWLLDNWQIVRPNKSTRQRRNPISIFNIK